MSTVLFVCFVGPALLVTPLWQRYGASPGQADRVLVVVRAPGRRGAGDPRRAAPGRRAGRRHRGRGRRRIRGLPDVPAVDAGRRRRGGRAAHRRQPASACTPGCGPPARRSAWRSGRSCTRPSSRSGGYVSSTTGDATQPASALTAIGWGFTVVPAVLVAPSMVFVTRYGSGRGRGATSTGGCRMSEARHEDRRVAGAARRSAQRLEAMRAHDLPAHGGRTLAYVYDSRAGAGRCGRPRGVADVRRVQRAGPDGVPVPAAHGERPGGLGRPAAERARRVRGLGDLGRDRVAPARGARCTGRPPGRRPTLDGPGDDGARRVPQGRALLRRAPGARGRRSRHLPRRPRGHGGGDRRHDGARGGVRAVLRARRDRPRPADRGGGGGPWGAVPRRRVHRRLGASVPGRRRAVDLRGARGHEHERRPAQVRLHPQGGVAAAAPRRRAAPHPVLRVRELARVHDAQLDRAVHQVRRSARRRVGGGAPHRRRGLRAAGRHPHGRPRWSWPRRWPASRRCASWSRRTRRC